MLEKNVSKTCMKVSYDGLDGEVWLVDDIGLVGVLRLLDEPGLLGDLKMQ